MCSRSGKEGSVHGEERVKRTGWEVSQKGDMVGYILPGRGHSEDFAFIPEEVGTMGGL